MTARGAVVVGAVCWLLQATATVAWAHDQRPGVLSLAETEPGVYALALIEPVDSTGDPVELALDLPPTCARHRDRVQCAGAMSGAIEIRGMRGPAMRTVVVVARLDGTRAEWMASAASPRVHVGGGPSRSCLGWIRIGIAHIVGGADHLAFVFGLLLLLGLGVGRCLLATLTAFTVAHSLTLALAVAGVVPVSAAAVEACIAASVLLVAREALHREPTATRRWPWLAAGAFGLVHGLGFASALQDLGFARGQLAWNLVLFNIGVELGQLAVVVALLALVWIGGRFVARRAWLGPRLHDAACYGLGSCAAWWFVQRLIVLASVRP